MPEERPRLRLPDTFVRTVTETFPEGRLWLDRLPELVIEVSNRWDLRMEDPEGNSPFSLSYHYVLPVLRADGSRVVLKLGVPGPDLRFEACALNCLRNFGCARLLACDEGLGSLLLERLEPGDTLDQLEDEERATRIAAAVMRGFWQAPFEAGKFRSLASWTDGLGKLRARFAGGTGPLPPSLVCQAEQRREELLVSAASAVLLHADLHHFNLLRRRDETWAAIDPKGVVGDRSYEPAAFLFNPGAKQTLDARLQRERIRILADETGIDQKRIADWAFVHGVLSAWWTIEDGGREWQEAIACVEVLASLDL